MIDRLSVLLLLFLLTGCSETDDATTTPPVRIASAMRNVMWKGQLGATIRLDTIADRDGLYGLGPPTGLRGELLINDGVSYLARVTSDTTMEVRQTYDVGAPFFVYSNVTDWQKSPLPDSVRSITDVEGYLAQAMAGVDVPFAFKLRGRVRQARIHVQNLAPGSTVSSPAEAHAGQVNYELRDVEADIVGFYSRAHQGVFTHHDSYVHLHLITADGEWMGHLDRVELGEVELWLPGRAGG